MATSVITDFEPIDTSQQNHEALIKKHFPPDASDTALRVAKAESNMNPSAINKNKNGTKDSGLFQINDVHIPALRKAGVISSRTDLLDPEKNVKAAALLHKTEGFKPWKSSEDKWGNENDKTTTDFTPVETTDFTPTVPHNVSREEFQSMSPTQRLMIGMGKGFMDVARGTKQLGLEAGTSLGLVSPGEADKYKKYLTNEERIYQGYTGRTPRTTSKPFGTTSLIDRLSPNKDPYAATGEFTGKTLPYLLLPGGAEERVGSRILSGALQGGIVGATQPALEGQTKTGQALTGAAFGAGTSALLSGIGKGYNALTGKVSETEAGQLGSKFGIRTTLGEETKRPFTQWIESLQEKIPVLGIRKFREAQNEEAASAAKHLLSTYIANPEMANMEGNRAFSGQLYEHMKSLLPGVEQQKINPTQTRGMASEFLKRYPDIFKMFQDTKTEGLLNNIIGGTKNVREPGALSVLNAPTSTAKTLTFDELWTLRDGIGDLIGKAKNKLRSGDVDRTQISQLNGLYKAVNNDIDTWTSSIGKPQISQAIRTANEAYKTYVKKYDVIQRAYDKAAGPEGAGKMFSPQQFSTALKNIIQKDKYYGTFKSTEIQEMTGLANIMQVVKRAGQFMENPPTGNRLAIPIIAGAEAAAVHFLGATTGAETMVGGIAITSIAKFLTSTPLGKNLIMAASKMEPESIAMQELVNQLYSMVPKAGAVAGTTPQPRQWGTDEQD